MKSEDRYQFLLNNRKPLNNSILLAKKKLIADKIKRIDGSIDLASWVNKEINFYVVPAFEVSKGKLFYCAWDEVDAVYVDIEFLRDPNNFDVIIHQLTHELLHSLCKYMNKKQISQTFNHDWFEDDQLYTGIDEATTQMFTDDFENTKLNEKQDPNLYFIKNIVRILKVIVGEEILLSQYLNGNDYFENYFNKITNDKFYEFAQLIKKIYHLNYDISRNKMLKKDVSQQINNIKKLQPIVIEFIEDIISKSSLIDPNLIQKLEREFHDSDFLDKHFNFNSLTSKKRS